MNLEVGKLYKAVDSDTVVKIVEVTESKVYARFIDILFSHKNEFFLSSFVKQFEEADPDKVVLTYTVKYKSNKTGKEDTLNILQKDWKRFVKKVKETKTEVLDVKAQYELI